MPDVVLSEDALRLLLKQAVVDALDERRDLIREAVAEALEDAALADAVREGQQTPSVTRDEVFEALRGDPA